jgi:hypothetical protein
VLRLTLFSVNATAEREFWWAIRRKDGTQTVGSLRFSPLAGLPGAVTRDVPVPEGELEFASIRSVAVNEPPGTCWAAIRLLEAQVPAPDAATPLISGWPGLFDGPTWPTHPVWPADGRGSPPVLITGDVPAAGVNPSITVALWEIVELLNASVSLTTSAVVADRTIRLAMTVGGVSMWTVVTAVLQAASLTRRWNWIGNGTQDTLTNAGVTVSSIGPAVPAGGLLLGAVQNLDAGDQAGALTAYARWQPIGV